MKRLNYTFVIALLSLACVFTSCKQKREIANYQVIPLPQEISPGNGEPFVLTGLTCILYPENNNLLKQNASFLADFINESTGRKLITEPISSNFPTENFIVLSIDENIREPEGYRISVDNKRIEIAGKAENGVFYGMQTLRKSIPAVAKGADIEFAPVTILDYPRFGYRGMHLDICRHFFPVEFIKKYIDILALHNINNFHWHLTDDQGWRIEIKKYPKLTEVGSMRKGTVIGRNTDQYDNTPYGGFYTQEEIKDVVAYAADRFINVIPEVDLPGHMLAALTAYPHLGCTGGPYEVERRWGIFDDVLCIGNEDAMIFLEDVLDEVTQLFPSKYVHIGGDEAPRTRWEKCPKCQARIKKEGIKADNRHSAEDRLQSYCMSRMEKFLNDRGRQVIGWDEILDGDVAPNAIVMSWRGLEGGIEAAKLGHEVIMVPTSYAYFDYYATDQIDDEPLGIGGFVPIDKVYSFDPVPEVLTDEEKKFIIGSQANLWTEYIPTSDHAEYMVLPRMAALSEVQWTAPEKKDYSDFISRLPRLLDIYDREGYNYGKHVFELKSEFTSRPDEKAVEVSFLTIDDAPIYYTLDGTEPTTSSMLYSSPLKITESADIRAAAIRSKGKSKEVTESICFNKATMKPITLTPSPSPKYTYGGAPMLVDGLKGGSSYASGRWIGIIGDIDAVIDLQEPTEIKSVATQANVDLPSWIMGATGLKVFVSDDNKSFREVGSKEFPMETDIAKHEVATYKVEFTPINTRYVKVQIQSSPGMPKGHRGEGRKPFIFIDEIVID